MKNINLINFLVIIISARNATHVCEAKHTLAQKTIKMDDELDNAPASYFGHVLQFKKPSSMFYMCSRNNNFSNRYKNAVLFTYVNPNSSRF